MGLRHSHPLRVVSFDVCVCQTPDPWFTTRLATDAGRLRKLYFDSTRHVVDNDKSAVHGRRAAYVYHYFKHVRPWAHHVMAEVGHAARRALGLPKAVFQVGDCKMHMVRWSEHDDPVGLFCATSAGNDVLGVAFVVVEDPTWLTRVPYSLTFVHRDGTRTVSTHSTTFANQAVFVPREWGCVVRGGDPQYMSSLKLLTANVSTHPRRRRVVRWHALKRTLRGFHTRKSDTIV